MIPVLLFRMLSDIVARAEYSTLTPHIRKLDQDMSWGAGFVDAIYRFGRILALRLLTGVLT